jgi:hypothetical protein
MEAPKGFDSRVGHPFERSRIAHSASLLWMSFETHWIIMNTMRNKFRSLRGVIILVVVIQKWGLIAFVFGHK